MVRFFLLGLVLSGAACSPRGWAARWYIVQAENAIGEAHHMKDKKAPFESRRSYYAKACGHYLKAYEIDPAVFTLIRIEEAADACWKAELHEEEQILRAFEEEYTKAHPQEAEYGDSGVAMMDMGG